MARTYAQVALTLADDDDFCALSGDAQLLYLRLLVSGSLNYCGVADWRPARLVPLVKTWTRTTVELAAHELASQRFIVIDESTEEVLIRTFVRHDGLMGKPRLAVSMTTAFSTVASRTLRGVIVHELKRLHEDQPELGGWVDTRGKPGAALDLLERPAVDPAEIALDLPSVCPSVCATLEESLRSVSEGFDSNACSGLPSVSDPPTPSPSTYTIHHSPSYAAQLDDDDQTDPEQPEPTTPQKRRRGTRLPEDFTVDDDMKSWAREHTPHINGHIETANFIDYWRAKSGKDATKLDWVATWRTWMRNAEQRAPQTRRAEQQAAKSSAKRTWTPPAPPVEIANDPAAYKRWYADQVAEHNRRAS